MGEAGCEPGDNRVTHRRNYDWNRSGSILRCDRTWCGIRYEHIDLAPDKVGHKGWQPIDPPVRKARLDQEVLAFDVA